MKMTLREFLAKQNVARAEWQATLTQVPKERMLEVVENGWTVKDIIAHVTWHEREMTGMIKQRALVGSDLWDSPLEERNQAIWEQNRKRSLDDVLNEAKRVYPAFIRALETLTDAELNDARHFREMPADWKPWEVIASNAFEHYPEHVTMLRKWLKKKP